MKKLILLIILGISLLAQAMADSYSQNMTVDILPGGIVVYSPVETLYTYRMIPINLTMNIDSKHFQFLDNFSPFRTLCRNCNEYGYSKIKKKPFDDGSHELIIKASFDEGSVYNSTNFTVDTRPPKIMKINPAGGFSSGEFYVEFEEKNPIELLLKYGDDIKEYREQDVDLGTCEYNRRTACKIHVNLSDYDGTTIEYWFEITDITNNQTESPHKNLKVDFSNPKVNGFNYTINRNRVNFFFNVTEPNFMRITYIDSDINQMERILCTKLEGGTCEKTKVFASGEHNLTIEILDKAGNSEKIRDIVFEIK